MEFPDLSTLENKIPSMTSGTLYVLICDYSMKDKLVLFVKNSLVSYTPQSKSMI